MSCRPVQLPGKLRVIATVSFFDKKCITLLQEGQGLGKHEHGMSTALQVEKTSKRGGRIIHEKMGMPPPPAPGSPGGSLMLPPPVPGGSNSPAVAMMPPPPPPGGPSGVAAVDYATG